MAEATNIKGTKASFDLSKLPNLEVPEAFREFAEKGATQTKQMYEKMKVTADQATDLLENTGSEPVVSDGVAAVVDQAGAIVGKASFEPQRLLPGERLPFHAEYSAELKPGRYRVLASFQYGKKVITNSADFMVP